MSSELDSSIISGKAFTAAQGPVAARAALKAHRHGEYMQRVNSFALMLYDKLYPNEEIEILRVTGVACPATPSPKPGGRAPSSSASCPAGISTGATRTC